MHVRKLRGSEASGAILLAPFVSLYVWEVIWRRCLRSFGRSIDDPHLALFENLGAPFDSPLQGLTRGGLAQPIGAARLGPRSRSSLGENDARFSHRYIAGDTSWCAGSSATGQGSRASC